jgi:non-specific serine/threonine protein kinase
VSAIVEPEVLDLLTRLVEKSLVVYEEDEEGCGRYRLLETVRQYARDRLRDRGEEETWRSRHLAHFVALAEEAEPQLIGAEQQAWMERLETEHDNLRAALGWSVNAPSVEAGLRLAGRVTRFWSTRGYYGEGRRWFETLLASSGEESRTVERASALFGAGIIARRQGDYAAARALFQETLGISRDIGDRRGIARSLQGMGIVAHEQGDFVAARELYEESLGIMRELGNRGGIAAALMSLGVAAAEQGEDNAARALYEESLAIQRELGNAADIANALHNLGCVAMRQGDYGTSRAFQEESLRICREIGDRWGTGNTLHYLGQLAQAVGDLETASREHRESLAIRREIGERRGIAMSLRDCASLASGLGHAERAALLWGAAERLREEIIAPLPPNERPGYEANVAVARAALGDDAAFDAAWREGRAMPLEQAIVYALEGE